MSLSTRGKSKNDARLQEERHQVLMALMNRPWISKQRDRELYVLARDHYRTLREWFHEQTGWSLVMTRHFVKLEKVPGKFQTWMAFDGFREPRDYGLFTFGLWYLEGLGENDQFLLTEMVETIREHLLGLGVLMDWTLYDHRLSMARALKKLRDMDVLVAVEGDETEWARSGGDLNVLYEASPMARYVLRSFERDLMSYESMEELAGPVTMAEASVTTTQEFAQDALTSIGKRDTSSAYVEARRHKIMRRLLEEPVVYDWQWTDEERRYVQTQRSSLIDRIRQATGLEGRRFREGLLFVWPELTAEMDLFPTQAAISDLVVLLAGVLRRELATEPTLYEWDEYQNLQLTRSELETLILKLRARYGEYWSKDHREKTARQLTDGLIAHLKEWNLGADDGLGGVRLFPGIARWNGDYQWEDGNE